MRATSRLPFLSRGSAHGWTPVSAGVTDAGGESTAIAGLTHGEAWALTDLAAPVARPPSIQSHISSPLSFPRRRESTPTRTSAIASKESPTKQTESREPLWLQDALIQGHQNEGAQ